MLETTGDNLRNEMIHPSWTKRQRWQDLGPVVSGIPCSLTMQHWIVYVEANACSRLTISFRLCAPTLSPALLKQCVQLLHRLRLGNCTLHPHPHHLLLNPSCNKTWLWLLRPLTLDLQHLYTQAVWRLTFCQLHQFNGGSYPLSLVLAAASSTARKLKRTKGGDVLYSTNIPNSLGLQRPARNDPQTST